MKSNIIELGKLFHKNKFIPLILHWFKKNQRNLYWRRNRNLYLTYLSEIMLQQTQVTTVIPYYNKWIVKFPTLNDVANASDEDLFKYWEGLGYYNRVNNFRIACNEVIEKFNGKVPSSKADLMQLKGIGDYTSSAIASIAFNKKNYVIDGNVTVSYTHLKLPTKKIV